MYKKKDCNPEDGDCNPEFRLTLTISRLGVTFTSKWKNDKGETPSGFFIDYNFSTDGHDYTVGIYYNVGIPISEETFILTSGMNISSSLKQLNE